MFFTFSSNLISTNSRDPDQTQHHAASDLDPHILLMSNENDARLVWVKQYFNKNLVNLLSVGANMIILEILTASYSRQICVWFLLYKCNVQSKEL